MNGDGPMQGRATRHLDQQLARFIERLCHEVGLTLDESMAVASHITADIAAVPDVVRGRMIGEFPVHPSKRIDELVAFNIWREHGVTKKHGGSLSIAPFKVVKAAALRAEIIVQSYLSHVYLTDACFDVVVRSTPKKSVGRRCARYLTDGAVQDFRNALAHANWCYDESFSGLECWVWMDRHKRHLGWRKFIVSQDDLNFWSALSR
jgi:hypothetical protein